MQVREASSSRAATDLLYEYEYRTSNNSAL